MPGQNPSVAPARPQLPWGPGGDMATNQAIDSLRKSLGMWLKEERGIHTETLLLVIGALAGFAGQCAALDRISKKEQFPKRPLVLSRIQTASGEIFF